MKFANNNNTAEFLWNNRILHFFSIHRFFPNFFSESLKWTPTTLNANYHFNVDCEWMNKNNKFRTKPYFSCNPNALALLSYSKLFNLDLFFVHTNIFHCMRWKWILNRKTTHLRSNNAMFFWWFPTTNFFSSLKQSGTLNAKQ